MATFVLVHGAYQGGWIWQPVATRLRAAGHTVYAPTLDGCAERQHLVRAGISVETHAREIAQLLFYEDLHDVALVGTSSGGMVVVKAAEQAREIRRGLSLSLARSRPANHRPFQKRRPAVQGQERRLHPADEDRHSSWRRRRDRRVGVCPGLRRTGSSSSSLTTALTSAAGHPSVDIGRSTKRPRRPIRCSRIPGRPSRSNGFDGAGILIAAISPPWHKAGCGGSR